MVIEAGNDPRAIFDHFYNDMTVKQFGRLGKFEFLALLGRLNLVPIEPGSPYLKGSTGPLAGARLLYTGSTTAKAKTDDLDDWLIELDAHLEIGMQAMEDSLCNWQKSPEQFVHFKG